VAKFVKAIRQDVHQESAQELNRMKRRGFGAFSAKSDGLGLDREQATIRDADAVGVAPEVLEHILSTTEGRLGVRIPGELCDSAHELREGLRVSEF
jgi:hypothetical protein